MRVDAIDRNGLLSDFERAGIELTEEMKYIIRVSPHVISTITRPLTGRWMWQDGGPFYCDNCGRHMYDQTAAVLHGDYRYCPWCGAKMEVFDDERTD